MGIFSWFFLIGSDLRTLSTLNFYHPLAPTRSLRSLYSLADCDQLSLTLLTLVPVAWVVLACLHLGTSMAVRFIVIGERRKGDAELYNTQKVNYEERWSKKWGPALVLTR